MNGTVSRPLMLEERDSESPDEWLDERDSESPELKAWFVAVSRRTKEGKNNVNSAAVDELVLRCNPQIFALNVAEEDGCQKLTSQLAVEARNEV